ncbi:hypothetical protein WR25_12428 [Diploscapter pachys]|uniref:Uncharacterized protein n=1 Tax=Diploscapter pachys TaxID=2018661 RepID=A0A2A2LM14_9BILA|nr:hypothetical protein WR25_12428 [Diploscapter pachys]
MQLVSILRRIHQHNYKEEREIDPNEDRWDELKWTSQSACRIEELYLLLVYLVTALVPSDTACFDSSPGRMRRTAV